MEDWFISAGNGQSLPAIFLPEDAGDIEKNAAQMLADEIQQKAGVTIPVETLSGWKALPLRMMILCSGSPEIPTESLGGLTPRGDEGFVIRTLNDQQGCKTVLAGQTGSGVLYAADELLDNISYTEDGISLPKLNMSDSPDCVIRGASFATHGYGRYVEDRDQLEKMKELVRFYARNRVNQMTVEATGKKWPGDLTPVVTWKYFPPLKDDSRTEMVMRRREHINELISYAHSWGVKVVLYTSEFNHEPDIYQRCPELHGVLPETWKEGRHNYIQGCICLSKEIAWDYWHAKVKEAMEALPELDGLELWLAEVPSEFGICSCPDCKKLSRHEWLERFFNAAREAIDEVRSGMPLYLKTFQSSQGSLEIERFAPLKGKFPHDSTVVTKGQFGDMAYLNDPHPLLGLIQDGDEATEFDVGGEYRGCGVGATICCIPEYLAQRTRLYYSRGVRRFYARHAVPTWPNKDLMSINDLAFYKLAWDVHTNIDELWHNWAVDKFGRDAAPGMIEILKMSDEAVNKSLYIRGACANRHYYIFSDNLDSFRYMMIDLSAQMIEGALERLEPTPQNIAAVIREKEEGIAICEAMTAKFREVMPLLSEDVTVRLDAILKRMDAIARVMRYLVEAIFEYFRFERCFSVRERDGMRPEILKMLNRCEEEINHVQKYSLEQAQGESLWGIWKVVDFERARRMCEEIRGLINFRIGQKQDYTVNMVPATTGHPNTYSEHRRQLKDIFGLLGD